MVPPLRKRHFYMWLLLGLLLPIGFVLSVMQIPKPMYASELPQVAPTSALPLEKAQISSERFTCIWLQNEAADSLIQDQIAIEVRSALQTPSCLVFSSRDPDSRETLLGKIEEKRTYRFTLPPNYRQTSNLYLHFYDGIKQQSIEILPILSQ